MYVKVKICDVRTLDIVECCKNAGADYIGIHQIKSPLSIDKRNLLKDIRDFSGDMKIVLVTKEEKMESLLELCLAFEWDCIQLHFEAKVSFIEKLKKELSERCNRMPDIIAVIQSDRVEKNYVNSLYKIVDYILFDSSMRGGSGKTSSKEILYKIPETCEDINYFVAGGLTSDNVMSTINISKPYAVDVQSGVEYLEDERKHQKDPQKIFNFVKTVKQC